MHLSTNHTNDSSGTNFSFENPPLSAAEHPTWGFSAVFSLLETIVCLLLNGLALVVFASQPRLCVHFNIYLINLSLANFVYFAVEGPLDIINKIYETWWLGSRWCTLYMYGLWLLSLVQFLTHPLIAVNRLWAIALPLAYRKYHSTRTAVFLCLLTWIVAHLVALPGVMLDAEYYRKPLNSSDGCAINPDVRNQGIWMTSVQFISVLSEAVILGVFPVIWLKQQTRKKVGLKPLKSEYGGGGCAAVSTDVKPHPSSSTGTEIVAHKQFKANSLATILPPITTNQAPAYKKQMHGFLLLTLLTTSVFICWTPSVIYFTIVPFDDISQPLIDTAVTLLYNFQAVIDPILFTLSLKELRNALRKVLCCRQNAMSGPPAVFLAR